MCVPIEEKNRDLRRRRPSSPIPYADESEPEIIDEPPVSNLVDEDNQQSQTNTLTRNQNVENVIYFQATAIVGDGGDNTVEEIYLDVGADEAMPTTVEPMNEVIETELSQTSEGSASNAVEMNELQQTNATTPADDEMKDVMEKLDEDLNRIVQMSDEIDRAIAMSGESQLVEQSTPMNQDEAEPRIEEVTMAPAAASPVDEEDIEVDRHSTATDSNAETDMYEDETMSTDGRLDHAGGGGGVPMAVEEEEDEDDYNDIDYIDEDEDVRVESGGEVEDMQRPFSAEVFERHVQQVITEDFPIDDPNKSTIAPAVHIITSRLNQIMNKEAALAKNPQEQLTISPSEVPTEFKYLNHFLSFTHKFENSCSVKSVSFWPKAGLYLTKKPNLPPS